MTLVASETHPTARYLTLTGNRLRRNLHAVYCNRAVQ